MEIYIKGINEQLHYTKKKGWFYRSGNEIPFKGILFIIGKDMYFGNSGSFNYLFEKGNDKRPFIIRDRNGKGKCGYNLIQGLERLGTIGIGKPTSCPIECSFTRKVNVRSYNHTYMLKTYFHRIVSDTLMFGINSNFTKRDKILKEMENSEKKS